MIEVKIGQPVPIQNPKVSTYELKVEAMSGDADHYQYNTMLTKDAEMLVKWLSIFKAYYELSWNARCDDNTVFRKIKQLQIEGVNAQDVFSDLVGRDVTTNDGRFAMASGIKVFWYDENGVKYDCEVLGLQLSI